MNEGDPIVPAPQSVPGTPEPGAPAVAAEAPAAAPEARATFVPAPTPAPARRPRPEWLMPLIVIAIAMIVLMVVSTAAVLTIGGSDAPTYPPGYWQGSALSSPWPIAVPTYGPGDVSKYDASTPENAFRSYINAITRGDNASADQMLSARARSIGDNSSLMAPPVDGSYTSVTIESSRETGDRATLNVTIHSSFGDGAGAPTLSWGEIVGLVREGDTWKIDTEENS